jgi:hypothetical protein
LYDGWKYHPKHVEQFPDINKMCDVASFWIYEYIGILLGAHPVLHISRIRVKMRRRTMPQNSQYKTLLIIILVVSKIRHKGEEEFL